MDGGGGIAVTSLRERHGRRLGVLRTGFRALRRATRPVREWLRRRADPATIQEQAPLAPEDHARRRRRWHVLVDLIHARGPASGAVVVDVGTYQGHSSAHVHKYCPQVARIFAVDLRRPDPARDRLRDLERVTFLHGESTRCAQGFADESIDLVFIDADHSEQAVAADLAAWTPKVKRGGVIAGHDYASRRHPGVQRAVDRFFRGHAHPVERAEDMVWWTIR